MYREGLCDSLDHHRGARAEVHITCVCVCAKHSVRCEYQHAPTEHRCYCRLTHLIRDAKAESEEMSVTVPEPEERELIQQRAGIRCE